MNLTKGAALVFALAAAGALVQAGVTGSSIVPSARLKSISSHSDGKGTELVIEATEPVPYMTTRPDAMTVVLEFRNVDAQSVTKKLAEDPKSPIASVTIENGDALGAPASRVRIALAQAVAHRVRSEKNSVIVEFDRANGKSVPYVMPPVSHDTADIAQAFAEQKSGGLDPIAALSLQALTPVAPVARPSATAQPAQQPPTSPSPVVSTGQTVGSQEKRWTGTPIGLTFEDADLKQVLNAIADEEGFNLSLDPGVTGTVNVHFTAVPWDQALDQILRANKLGYIVDGSIVRIAPILTLSSEAEDRRKLADAQANEGELHTLTKTLSYAKADEMMPLLTKSNTLSTRGSVQVDQRTNTLIITDLQARIDAATDLIAILDKAQPQVEIEARIVQTNKSYARALGVQWGFAGRMSPQLGNTTNLAFPNSGSVGGATGATGPTGNGSAVNLPVAGATTAVGLALGSVNGAFNLDVALSALESSGNGRVLSTPRVATLNNVEAEMTQGVQIPLQTISNNTVTVTFRDAALTLRVTPQITASDTVIMKVALENSTPDFSRAAGPAAIPPINTQRANTTLLVSDGQTTVIGGVFTSNQQTSRDNTPGLSQIPIFSWLFKRDRVDDSSSELLIFITPHIMKG